MVFLFFSILKTKMKYLHLITSVIILLLIISWFVSINQENYKKHVEIRDNYVNHPEWLITKELANATSFWFANLKADLLWLQTIQYIWWNAVSSQYKKYLFAITDIITELNPYFEHPYILVQLLLPGENLRYESLSKKNLDKNTDEAIKIWLKGIQNFCTATDKNWKLKIDWIKNQNNLLKIWSEEEYKNPCKSYKIPYYLAYVYFHYKNDPATASDYYKIASANEDSVDWAKSMAAIMAWKWWNREKSIFMFLNIAELLDTTDNQTCSVFSKELTNVARWVFLAKKLSLNENLIKTIQEARVTNFWLFSEDQETQLSDTECINFLNKANRELNLAFLDQANEKYKIDNNWSNAHNWDELLNKWYIKFLPTDFQQYDDHWIKYEYNEDIWVFDYNMNY